MERIRENLKIKLQNGLENLDQGEFNVVNGYLTSNDCVILWNGEDTG